VVEGEAEEDESEVVVEMVVDKTGIDDKIATSERKTGTGQSQVIPPLRLHQACLRLKEKEKMQFDIVRSLLVIIS